MIPPDRVRLMVIKMKAPCAQCIYQDICTVAVECRPWVMYTVKRQRARRRNYGKNKKIPPGYGRKFSKRI